MSIQGQRVISTTGIKCVGNTVRLHGQTYAPPYVIKAVGDAGALGESLDNNEDVLAYISYADEFQLGWELVNVSHVEIPPYKGSVELRYAKPAETTDSSDRKGS